MPRFRCLKEFWNFSVDVDGPETARMIFRCGECSVYTGHCLGVEGKKVQSPLCDLSRALQELADTAPTKVPVWLRISSTAPGGGLGRNLYEIVQQHYADIVLARNKGHSYSAIAEVFCEHGIEISRSALRNHYTKINNEREMHYA